MDLCVSEPLLEWLLDWYQSINVDQAYGDDGPYMAIDILIVYAYYEIQAFSDEPLLEVNLELPMILRKEI